ncbi:hypothetical protein BHE90_010320 [Fusarium euwallaceae]|uniref:Uncharacterized protein n=4 Tax=Fusarium solani species complex TaxID=232080 RepID=A0A3M2RW60_9HYPO|nr:hypothetical protein CDV36_010828 [Fusarium kuroshium]RSL84986.1 hypothetical protein CEP51_003575 [Fusarium floridanum]RSM07737.1 hypothetical protein CEP52_005049 [Fusarium oligoseptatum]RTE75235.1 hypothetical protein BHE90_010320 [Fusarium euwallaceae]
MRLVGSGRTLAKFAWLTIRTERCARLQLAQDAEITPYLNSRRLLDLEPTSAVVVTAQWRFSQTQRQGRLCSLMYDSHGGATMPGARSMVIIGRSPSRPREDKGTTTKKAEAAAIAIVMPCKNGSAANHGYSYTCAKSIATEP